MIGFVILGIPLLDGQNTPYVLLLVIGVIKLSPLSRTF